MGRGLIFQGRGNFLMEWVNFPREVGSSKIGMGAENSDCILYSVQVPINAGLVQNTIGS